MPIRQQWSMETYEAWYANVRAEKRKKLEADVANRQPEEEKEPTDWMKGIISAKNLADTQPDAVPFRLERARKELEAREVFHWANPEVAGEKLEYTNYSEHYLEGEIQELELICRSWGIRVPTAKEREKEAIDRLVEMEAVGH